MDWNQGWSGGKDRWKGPDPAAVTEKQNGSEIIVLSTSQII